MGWACTKSWDGAPRSNWTSDRWLWRQMLYYILVTVKISCIRASIRVENQYDDSIILCITLCCACPNSRTVKSLSRHFPRSLEQKILLPLSVMGVWKNNQISIVEECASHVTLFVHALSLELAALAIR